MHAHAGSNLEVRAAKTTAELSTWSGNNPLCAAFKLTTANLGVLINCTQPMVARYMTIADVDTNGDSLPVCSMDALVNAPLPPAPPPAGAAGAPGPGATALSSISCCMHGTSLHVLVVHVVVDGCMHAPVQARCGTRPWRRRRLSRRWRRRSRPLRRWHRWHRLVALSALARRPAPARRA